MSDRSAKTASESFSVEFDVTRADMEAAVTCQLKRIGTSVRGSRREALLMSLLAAVSIGFMVFRMTKPGLGQILILSGYGLLAGWLLLRFSRLTGAPMKKAIDHTLAFCGESSMLGHERITISPTGVCSDHAFQSTSNAWAGVLSIELTDERIIIRTDSAMMHTIPRKAFDSVEHLQEFAEIAQLWHRQYLLRENCPNCQRALRGGLRDRCPECGWRRGT